MDKKSIIQISRGDEVTLKKVITLDNIAIVEAIIPLRDENGGNFTKVIIENGFEWTEEVRCNTYVKGLARVVSFDTQAWIINASKVISRSHGIPLPLHPGVVLVPVKVRIAEYKDEGTSGYVNLLKIEGMERVDKKITRLFFCSGLEVDVMSSYGNLNPLLIQARCCYEIQFKSFRNFFKQKEKILL